MSDLIDDLDTFAESSVAKTPERPELIPMQHEVVRGTWALQLGSDVSSVLGMMGGMLSIRVGYVFDTQDYAAMSAIEGAEVANERQATADAEYEDGIRWGRWYSESSPQGVFESAPVSGLVPISEEQAREAMFFDFKLPLLAMMSDWFRPLIEEVVESISPQLGENFSEVPCPECGADTALTVTYDGRGIFLFYKAEEDGEAFYQLGPVMQDGMTAIGHVHMICANEDCEYNEHVDTGELEVRLPGRGHIGRT